ncbi:LacI family DNA-binding transcriptional regulator [Isoptericola sp. NPDC056578]|uniref:LacI family DNA-binding transcriptional regulator n=1 Tax=unclassified Isoptericola TaxID=2623355 RepID=UPI0036751357
MVEQGTTDGASRGAGRGRVRSPGIKDVAAAAGVSWKTVSNVVNGTGRVGEATRARVEGVIADLGYRPSLAGRQLRQGRTRTFALAVPWIHAPYFAELAHVMIEVAGGRGYRVLIEETRGDRDVELEVARGFAVHAIDGIVFSPLALGPAEISGLRGATPMVLLGERDDPGLAGGRRTDHVSIDNVGAAEEVTRHLVASGRRRLGFLGAEPEALARTGAPRLRGFRAACAEAGIEVDERWILPGGRFSRADGAAAVESVLARTGEIDGLVCANDELALGAVFALRTNGIGVPDDVAVTGWDNTEDGRYANPSLTTVAPDVRAIAEAAVDRLVRRIDPAAGPDLDAAAQGDGGSDVVDLVVPHRLLMRESTRAGR